MSKKNIFINTFIMAIILLFIISLTVKSGDKENIVETLKTVNIKYIILGIVLSVSYIIGEGIGIKILLKIFDYNISIFKTVKYAFIGFFFSSITPSATGGQPMQIYRMTKDDIEVSHSSLVLLIQLMTYQLSTFTIGLIGYISFRNTGIINNVIFKYLILTGLLVDLIGLSFIGICIFNPKVSNLILKLVNFLLGKISFVKEDSKRKIMSFLELQIEDYNSSSKYILKNKGRVFSVFLVTFTDLLCLFGVSYMVYRSLGEVGYGIMDIVLFQGIIYIASYFIPVPGSMGVSEGNYLNIFKKLYSSEKLKSSMILSRGISFYFLLFLSGSIFLFDKLIHFKLREA